MTSTLIAVTNTHTELQQQALRLAADLRLEYVADADNKIFSYLLVITPDFIGLQKTSDKRFKPFYIDFTSGKLLYRSQQAGLRKELIARAIGIKPKEHPRIIDATAGLGRDSFILATLGFEVTMLERSPILFTLLNDAIERARKHPQTTSIIERLTLIHADAISWLQQNTQHPDIIYLDPMFPGREKSASVKKEMAILQDLLGKDTDCDTLFETALTCAAKKVVVKRPRLAKSITNKAPNFSLEGKSSRFDVYIK